MSLKTDSPEPCTPDAAGDSSASNAGRILSNTIITHSYLKSKHFHTILCLVA